MSDDTLLVLQGIGIPDYSARGLTQTLEPIQAAASIRRTINGALDDLSVAQFRKYASTISADDQQPPAYDGVWPGTEVTVSCVAELCYLESSSPTRDVVSGSERTVNGYVFYRPVLTMMVISMTLSLDEWGSQVSWQMQLEEV